MKRHEQATTLLRKAMADQKLVEKVLQASDIADEIIGFHCQQAIEKCLKAVLSQKDIAYRKTHDIRELMGLLEDNETGVPEEFEDIDFLTPYAALMRYEADLPTEALNRQDALEKVKAVRH